MAKFKSASYKNEKDIMHSLYSESKMFQELISENMPYFVCEEELMKRFSDKDISIIAKSEPVNVMAGPILNNPSMYSKYALQLGNADKKSKLFQNNVPKIAAKQYLDNDSDYILLFKAVVGSFITTINELLAQNGDDSITIENFGKQTPEKIFDIVNSNIDLIATGFDSDLFIVQLKVCGLEDDEEKQGQIKELFDNHINMLNEQIKLNKEAEKQQKILQKQKEKERKKEEKLKKQEELEKKAKEEAAEKNKIAEEKAKEEKLAAEKKKQEEEEKKRKIEERRLKQEQEKEKKKIADAEKKQSQIDNVNKEDVGTVEEIIEEKSVLTAEAEETKDTKTELPEADNVYKGTDKIMNTYVGAIEVRQSFYNFRPIAEYVENDFLPLSENDKIKLIPHSQFGNINLYYNPFDSSQYDFMERNFYEGQLVLFEFTTEDLEDNIVNGVRNQTGYKVSVINYVKSGKIRPLHVENLYMLYDTSIFVDDINNSKIVKISDQSIHENDKILINLKGFYAGPYTVNMRAIDSALYIRTDLQENGYTLSGYSSVDYERMTIEEITGDDWYSEGDRWYVYRLRKGAQIAQKDVMSDEQLLASFGDAFSNQDESATVNDDNQTTAISQNQDEALQDVRFERLSSLLMKDDKNSLVALTDSIINLIIENKDSEQVEAFINTLLSSRSDITENIPVLKDISAKIANARDELTDLELQKQNLEENIEREKNEADELSRKLQEENITNELAEKKKELDRIKDILEGASSLEQIQKKAEKYERIINESKSHQAKINADNNKIEEKFEKIIDGYEEKMVELAFDGFLSSKLVQAASNWDNMQNERSIDRACELLNDIEINQFGRQELLDYLTSTIKIARPQYDYNTIINILTCIMQGFITVFSGAPGCGKTSICNIVAKVLGLNRFNDIANNNSDISLDRYISVSVERGWTSKKDLIGYYNPLTKSFEESNRRVYDGLKILDLESNNGSRFPFMILLDEANLSPMEYYWADFMNVCDDLDDNHQINMGSGNILNIPDTLRFVATINNDSTTEPLSPRLVNRAWIISLPKSLKMSYGSVIPDSLIRNVSWDDLKGLFVPDVEASLSLGIDAGKKYEGLKNILSKAGISVSPRAEMAIYKYYKVASQLMKEDEYGNGASLVALDFAISQRILPMIAGNGDEYGEWLESLKNYCANSNMVRSADIIEDIINRGNHDMKYYQFFN